jgi:hypothetical protein
MEYCGSNLKKRVCMEAFLDDYKGIHFALEVKSFLSGLSLRWISVWGPAIGSLDLPLVATIGIVRREREREGSPTNRKNNKTKPK